MLPKHWWKSKTVWVNALGAVIFLLQTLSGETWWNPQWTVIGLAVSNGILRFITKSPIGK